MEQSQELEQPASPDQAKQPEQTQPAKNPEQPGADDDARRPVRLPGVHLQVELGSALSLRFLCVQQRYEGKIVGLEPFSFLIVQARVPQDTVARLPQNPGLVVQLRTAGQLFGFRSEVMNHVTNPAPLFFLTFPAMVERLTLRRDERVSVSLPGTIHGPFGDHEVMLMDLTSSGCALSTAIDLKSPLRGAKPGDKVILNCGLGQGQHLTAALVLRRVEEGKGRLLLGGQFQDLPEDTAQIVAKYIQKMLRFVRE